MQTVFVVFACVSMAITAPGIIVFLALLVDDVIVARRYYRALLAEIREAVENIDEIYGEEEIRSSEVLYYLKRLHDRRRINWSQVKIDLDDERGSTGA